MIIDIRFDKYHTIVVKYGDRNKAVVKEFIMALQKHFVTQPLTANHMHLKAIALIVFGITFAIFATLKMAYLPEINL